jgi:hypothetical protein
LRGKPDDPDPSRVGKQRGHRFTRALEAEAREREMVTEVSRLFRPILEKVPPHGLAPWNRMDNILCYYSSHCDAWDDAKGYWQGIERFEGAHVF